MKVLFIKTIFAQRTLHQKCLWIWSHLLKTSLRENFILCAVAISDRVLKNHQLYKWKFVSKHRHIHRHLKIHVISFDLMLKPRKVHGNPRWHLLFTTLEKTCTLKWSFSATRSVQVRQIIDIFCPAEIDQRKLTLASLFSL